MKHVVLREIGLKRHPELTEQWVQGVISEDPSLLGFGELDVRDTERRQPQGGRLDMLLSDLDNRRRYEVELQLGAVDESHIIRTLEYWDGERRRYPQYDHVAVLVAEEITNRFFRVIALFNGFIPIVAIKMTGLRVDEDEVALVFTKVLDHSTLGTEEEIEGAATNRGYWEKIAIERTMKVVDRIHDMVKDLAGGWELNYNKHFIGLSKHGVANNWVQIIPQKKKANVQLRIPRSDDVDDMIDEAGVGSLPHDGLRYRLIIPSVATIDSHSGLLKDLIGRAKP